MEVLRPPAGPGGFSPNTPAAAIFTLDPYSEGAHGQDLPPASELGPPPTDCLGPLCPDPSAGKSGHLVSAGLGGQGSQSSPRTAELAPELAPELARGGQARPPLPGFPCHPRESWFLS